MPHGGSYYSVSTGFVGSSYLGPTNRACRMEEAINRTSWGAITWLQLIEHAAWRELLPGSKRIRRTCWGAPTWVQLIEHAAWRGLLPGPKRMNRTPWGAPTCIFQPVEHRMEGATTWVKAHQEDLLRTRISTTPQAYASLERPESCRSVLLP